MSLRIYQLQNYEQTHEREQFQELCDKLIDRYDNTEETNLLFSNINFNGVPLDALFVKPDAIIVLEFKNYGGHVIAAENGNWKLDDVDGTVVKGGNKGNPYVQTKDNKFNVIDVFNDYFHRDYVELGHVTGVVVFNQTVTVDDTHLPPKIKTWFHITDMGHIISKIQNITSPKIRYSEQDLEDLPAILNCEDYMIYPDPFEVYEDEDDYEEETILEPIEEEEDDGAEFVSRLSQLTQGAEIEYGGGQYRGGLNKEGKPEGEGFLLIKNKQYRGVFQDGEPNENELFTVTFTKKIQGTEYDIEYQGTLNKDLTLKQGVKRVIDKESGNTVKKYEGRFEGWDFVEGKFYKREELEYDALFSVIVSGGKKFLVPQYYKVNELTLKDEPYADCVYTGYVSICNDVKIPNGEGVLTDRKGYRFEGVFKDGKRNGTFKIFRPGSEIPQYTDVVFKDDVLQ